MTHAVYGEIPLDAIREPEHQLRERIEPQALGELADSMAAEGLHQAIGVRGPDPQRRYHLVWGHRRYLAARLLAWRFIAARVFPLEYDPLLAAVSENLQRTDLTPLEEARACPRFVERGQPVPAIARLFRRTDVWVRERLALLDLPEDLQAVVAERTLPLAVVRVLGDIDHAEYRVELIREALRVGATAATAELWRAHYLTDRERILHNRETVQEISSRREAWKIMVPCELCAEDHEYPDTVSLRICGPCRDAILALVEREARAAAPGGG